MKVNFIEELRWRGMIQDIMPGTEEALLKETCSAYIGFDPTAPSLTVGNLVAIMLLVHFQRAGHKPYVLMGGATGMVGDPSGKSEERKQMSLDTIAHNLDHQKGQFYKFLDFTEGPVKAELLNNFDWFGEFKLLDFLRDVGKHLTLSYMMAKDSVKSRMETGISFTEFSYQLLQGYDFFHLNKNHQVSLQMGGSDQWGNITAGTELIRRMSGGEAYALTSPLLVKADGTKFGKSSEGNVWLDADLTSPYKFYQFWLNTADAEISRSIRYFSFLGRVEIEALEAEHLLAPHLRLLQKTLARELTMRIHGEELYEKAIKSSELLFGGGSAEFLAQLTAEDLYQIFEGLPQFKIQAAGLAEGVEVLELLAVQTTVFPSKGEARKMIDGGGLMINKVKITDAASRIIPANLLASRFLIVQKGKKNYFLLEVV